MNLDLLAQTERGLLGCILLDNSTWSHTADLSSTDFSLSSHTLIYGCMAVMFEDQRTVDSLSLAAELDRMGKLQSIGDYAYLGTLLSEGTTASDVASHVRYIKEASTERQWNREVELFTKATSRQARGECLTVLQDLNNGTTSQSSGELIVVRGDQAEEKALRWAWKYYLPLGKLVHFGGNSSQAKSPVTVDISARTTTGADWPDGTKNTLGSRSVIMLNIEDDFEDTILPRFRLAGGDKSRLHYIKGTKILTKTGQTERLFTLESDMERLLKLAGSIPDLGLIVIDPITNYLGGKKFIDEAEVRSILTPLANLARELDVVANTVGHFNRRDRGTDPLHRNMGAAAFHGAARAVFAFGPDPDVESKYAHIMAASRGCGGEGAALKYHTELVPDRLPNGDDTEIIKVVWDGKSEATAEDSVDPTPQREKAQEDEAAELLRELLREGKRSAKECSEMLKAEGYDLDKLNAGRVRRKAGADSKRFPGDKFNSWYLPLV